MAQPPSPRPTFFRSAAIVSAAVSLSRVTGLVREMVMARLFGAGAAYDAFLLGFRIPNLARDLFAEGALSSAFVPTFTRYLATGDREDAARLSRVLATSLILVVGCACVAGIVFTPQLVRLMAPGFAQVPGKFELAVLLTRIMFPFLVLVAIAAQAMGVLNACDRYGVPALASAMFNLASVTVGVALGYTIGRRFAQGAIVSMAIGVVAGGTVQWLWQLSSLRKVGFPFYLGWDFGHPGLRQILALMLPAILGSAAVQVNVMVNTNFASSITDAAGRVMDGPVSWLGYAFRFMQLPLGVFGVAIASATLPAVSRSAALRRMDEFRDAIAQSVGMAVLLTVPASVGLAVLGESMIGAVYQGGRFQAFDTHQTAVALACYSVGLAAYAVTKILAPAFYALNDSRTPMLVSLASIAVNYGFSSTLVRAGGLGHAGLALSTSAVAVFGAAALFEILRRRVGGLHGGRLGGSVLRIGAASAVMGAACYVSSLAVHRAGGNGRAAHFADVAISIPIGIGMFYAMARALQVREVETVRAACYTAIKKCIPT